MEELMEMLKGVDLKLKYLKGFLNRTKLSVEDFDSKLKELENRIREFGPFVPVAIYYFKEFKEAYAINIEIVSSPKHFIDLLRIIFMPSSPSPSPSSSKNNKKIMEKIDHVHSLSQLWEAGLKFEVCKNGECLLDLKFDEIKGVLKIPCFHVGDNTEIYLKNILVFEEWHYASSSYIGQYLRLLDFLINTEKDVSILIEEGIIINYMSDIISVATMINSLCKNVYIPYLNDSCYHSLCLSLNGFYENPLNKYKAMFIYMSTSTLLGNRLLPLLQSCCLSLL